MNKLEFFGESYDDLDKKLYTFALVACNRYKLHTSYAEDIKQELWVKALILVATYNPNHISRARFSTYIAPWMNEVANRKARMEKDKHVKVKATTLDRVEDNLSRGINDPDYHINSETFMTHDRVDELMDVKNLLKELNPILVMNGMDMTDEEIAEILEIPVNQITAARREAYKELVK